MLSWKVLIKLDLRKEFSQIFQNKIHFLRKISEKVQHPLWKQMEALEALETASMGASQRLVCLRDLALG
jgi:hypothetical protein